MSNGTWSDLADDWLDSSEALVETALDLDEKLVWVGRPTSRMALVLTEWRLGFEGFFFVAFTLMWWIPIAIGGQNNWDRGKPVPPLAMHNVHAMAVVSLVVFLPVGLVMLSAPFRTWCRAPGVSYALTDRRAVVCQIDRKGCRIVEQLLPRSVALMEVRKRDDGSGDLIFGSRPNWMQRNTLYPYGFLRVDNIIEIEALVRKTLMPLAS